MIAIQPSGTRQSKPAAHGSGTAGSGTAGVLLGKAVLTELKGMRSWSGTGPGHNSSSLGKNPFCCAHLEKRKEGRKGTKERKGKERKERKEKKEKEGKEGKEGRKIFLSSV